MILLLIQIILEVRISTKIPYKIFIKKKFIINKYYIIFAFVTIKAKNKSIDKDYVNFTLPAGKIKQYKRWS